jgi:hypothetical protein
MGRSAQPAAERTGGNRVSGVGSGDVAGPAKTRRLAACLALALAACSDGSDSSSPTSTASTATSTTVLSGAPTASLRLTGDAPLTGALTGTSVRCAFPALDGLRIAVLGQTGDAAYQFRIALRAARVTVTVSSGTDSDYHERVFEGAGVTSFDAADGAVVAAALAETPGEAGATPDGVGALTAIDGSVDCGEQTTGSSSVTITGSTAEGALSRAVLDPVRVECDETPDGDEIYASGLVRVGSATALFGIGLASDGSVSVEETLPSGRHRYAADGETTITPTGGQVRADVVEEDVPAPHTLHVEGDLTCGRHAAG